MFRAMLIVVVLAVALSVDAAREPVQRRPGVSNEDYRAYSLLKQGVSYLEANNDEQGLKRLADIPRMFPKSPVRFQAWLELGKHSVERQEYDAAIRFFTEARESEEAEERAEALYRIGICHYERNEYDKAFLSLRKVTDEFPWSVYANEAYYYIGLCHFKLKRWSRAVDALKRVGVSVPPDVEARRAEAGRRLWIKVDDRDLAGRLTEENSTVTRARLRVKSGDEETVELRVNSRDGSEHLGSIETEPGEAQPNDGHLQILGGDTITVEYIDETTESGETNHARTDTIQIVSTAAVGFTDGAYRDYARGVRGDTDAFVRARDLDANTSPATDTLTVRIVTEYKRERETQDLEGVDLTDDSDLIETRDAVTVTLRESGAMTGLFVGSVTPRLLPPLPEVDLTDPNATPPEEPEIAQDDEALLARVGDRIRVEYLDERHINDAEGPREATYETVVLASRTNDVEASQWVVEDEELKARKLLIEARILLRLSQIFKDVGLLDKAYARADGGLERVEEVIQAALTEGLRQALLEDGFNIKWELLLVKDELAKAVDVCNTLLRLFPASAIADQALLKIGQAKMESDAPEDWREAIVVFRAVQKLQASPLRAEAEFFTAQALEKIHDKREEGRPEDEKTMSQEAIQTYKRVADTWPE